MGFMNAVRQAGGVWSSNQVRRAMERGYNQVRTLLKYSPDIVKIFYVDYGNQGNDSITEVTLMQGYRRTREIESSWKTEKTINGWSIESLGKRHDAEKMKVVNRLYGNCNFWARYHTYEKCSTFYAISQKVPKCLICICSYFGITLPPSLNLFADLGAPPVD